MQLLAALCKLLTTIRRTDQIQVEDSLPFPDYSNNKTWSYFSEKTNLQENRTGIHLPK